MSRVYEVQAGVELTIIFTQIHPSTGALVTGQAGSITKALRDQDGDAIGTNPVTVEEQGTSGFYEARFTPTKSAAAGHSYLLRLTSPTPATDGAVLEFPIRAYPTLAVSETVGAFFTSLAAVKEYMELTGTGSDALITNLIARVTRVMQDRLERKVLQATYTEVHDGIGRPGFLVVERPIASVTSLHESQDQVWDSSTLISASDYLVDALRGRVWLKGDVFLPGFQNVRIVYVGGWATIPAALEHVAIRTVAREMTRRKSLDILSMTLKDGSVTKHISAGFTKDDLEDMAPWVRRRAA